MAYGIHNLNIYVYISYYPLFSNFTISYCMNEIFRSINYIVISKIIFENKLIFL